MIPLLLIRQSVSLQKWHATYAMAVTAVETNTQPLRRFSVVDMRENANVAYVRRLRLQNRQRRRADFVGHSTMGSFTRPCIETRDYEIWDIF
jgi:hypothetical protein